KRASLTELIEEVDAIDPASLEAEAEILAQRGETAVSRRRPESSGVVRRAPFRPFVTAAVAMALGAFTAVILMWTPQKSADVHARLVITPAGEEGSGLSVGEHKSQFESDVAMWTAASNTAGVDLY